MVDDTHQIEVPPSFIALYVPAGRIKPTLPWVELYARYEYCEDLAQMLTETAQTQLWQLGITESDVLERVARGLDGGAAGVSEAEAVWVVSRLAEVLGWSL